MNKTQRIIFRLDSNTLEQLKNKSRIEGLQQTKLIKKWLAKNINDFSVSIYKTKILSKLSKTITLYIDSNLVKKLDSRASHSGQTRSNYIFSTVYRELNYSKLYKEDVIPNQTFDSYYRCGKFNNLILLVADKIDLLTISQLIDYAMVLVLLGKNNKTKEVIELINQRQQVEDRVVNHASLKNHGRLLIVRSRLARAIDSANKSALLANEALKMGINLKDRDLITQALLRLTSAYLGSDDFFKAQECINKIKTLIDLSSNPTTLVYTYILETYISLYLLDFRRVMSCINKAKSILAKNPHDYFRSELLYLELRAGYFLLSSQDKWMRILSNVVRHVNITGSEIQKIAAYESTAAFFIRNNKENIGLQYVQKALKLENIYFKYTYNKSTFSNIMYLFLTAKNNLNYFVKTIDGFIFARKQKKDDYLSYEYLRASAKFIYSKNIESKTSAIKKLEFLKTNKVSPAIAYVSQKTLSNKTQFFIR